MATVPLLVGDLILEGKLAPAGRGASALLRPGEVAAPVRLTNPLPIAIGERVRVTATFDPERYAGHDLVRVVAPAALVVAKDDKGLLVSVSPAERDQLALAEVAAHLDVALLPPGT
jgi:hypothetical protein